MRDVDAATIADVRASVALIEAELSQVEHPSFPDRHPWVTGLALAVPFAGMAGWQFLSDNTQIIIGLLMFCLLLIGGLLWLLSVLVEGTLND